MINSASSFIDIFKSHGIDFFSGVPCSLLKEIIAELTADNSVVYVSATREDEAVGIASGAYLAGKTPVVLMQNSGLGNSLNTLLSHNLIYKIPCLIIMGWRGYKGRDVPEHIIIGEINNKLLDVAGVPSFVLEKDNFEKVVADSVSIMNEKKIPVTILLREGIIE